MPEIRSAAAEWLTRYLFDAGEPVAYDEVVGAARERGFTLAMLQRAADDMQVVRAGDSDSTWALSPDVIAVYEEWSDG